MLLLQQLETDNYNKFRTAYFYRYQKARIAMRTKLNFQGETSSRVSWQSLAILHASVIICQFWIWGEKQRSFPRRRGLSTNTWLVSPERHFQILRPHWMGGES